MATLNNKNILITGASDGIGKTLAITYAKYGANVILHGRNQAKLQAVADEIYSITQQKVPIILLDLLTATEHDYQTFAVQLSQMVEHLDGVVHNAGILGDRVELLHYHVQTWSDVFTVNVNAPLLMTQAILPLLQKSSSASVIFTSSGVGRAVREAWGAYSISKIALEAINQLLSLENKTTNIRYNCVNPGATRTAMRALAFPQEDPMTLPTAEQIMPIYVYLMADESQHISGQSLDAQKAPFFQK